MRVNGIISDSIVDGPGLRTTIFFQGCQRHCPGCHNPQTWDCDTGIEVTPGELLKAVIEKGAQDITLSGGEPLLQAKEIVQFLEEYNRLYPNNNVWLWTGSKIDDVFQQKDYAGCNSLEAQAVFRRVDYIVDGAFMLDKRDITLKYRGSGNQRIIKVNTPIIEENAIWIEPQFSLSYNDVTKEMDPRND